eukprot:m.137141 g.137141  ORF g.137141 m.137141 type:complete len:196 (+) comp13148_c0_seq9:987-1574(+)
MFSFAKVSFDRFVSFAACLICSHRLLLKGRAFVYKRNHPEYEVIYPSGGAGENLCTCECVWMHCMNVLLDLCYLIFGVEGYVLSQASLRAVGENPKLLKAGGAVEDMELARILRKLDIHIEDTRDSEGRERFLPFRLDQLRKHFTRVAYPTLWFWAYSYFYPKEGMVCICVCVYVCMHVCVCLYVCMYVHVCCSD